MIKSRARTAGIKISINLRTLSAPLSGVQRYAKELDSRFGDTITRLRLKRRAQGALGHLWEQLIVPLRCRGRLLFSPGNTGPLLYRHQVVTIHDASTFDQAGAFTGLFGYWYRWLLPRLAKRVRGVITVSEFSRVRLAATLGISINKIAVVYNGITQPPPPQSESALLQIRKQLNLPQKFLLFVGSRDPRKNVDRLIAAFSIAKVGDLHLVLAGGSNRQLFNGNASSDATSRVHALGQVDELVLEALYAMAEGFVFPSLYEGFGLPPLEAMARGCPVICSNASCMPEICGPDFEHGGACLYFSPLDTESIAGALEQFASLPISTKQLMIEAGRKRSHLFSWDRCAKETTDALQSFATQPFNESTTGRAQVDSGFTQNSH